MSDSYQGLGIIIQYMDTPIAYDEKKSEYSENRDEDRPKGGNQMVIKPPKSGRLPKNQSIPVRDYSTVTDLARFLG